MEKLSGKTTYAGAGIGLALFAILGLLPGSLLGGAMGLNLAGMIFGFPVSSGVLSRMIVAASMLTGVIVAAIIFVLGSALLGWMAGTAVDALRAHTGAAKEAAAKIKNY